MRQFSALVVGIALLFFHTEGFAQSEFLVGYSSYSSNQTPSRVAKEEG